MELTQFLMASSFGIWRHHDITPSQSFKYHQTMKNNFLVIHFALPTWYTNMQVHYTLNVTSEFGMIVNYDSGD